MSAPKAFAKKFAFVSFASPQKSFASRLNEELRKIGVETFFSAESLETGKFFDAEIDSRLDSENCVLVPLLTDDFFDDKRVSSLEFNGFLLKHRANVSGKIFPIMIGQSRMPIQYLGLQYFSTNKSNFDRKLPDIARKIKELVEAVDVKVAVRRNALVENDLSSWVEAEWGRLVDRKNELKLTTGSTTHVFLYGWIACLDGEKKIVRPEITTNILKNMSSLLYNCMHKSMRIELIRNVCTFRYFLFCFLLSKEQDAYPDYMFQSFLDGLSSVEQRVQVHIEVITAAVEKISGNCLAREIKPLIEEIMKALGAVVAIQNISIEEILREEKSFERADQQKVKAHRLVIDNSITHEITIYFEDKKTVYFSIVSAISHEVEMNVIQSRSETLVPGSLAMATFLVCAQDAYLVEKLNRAISRKDVRRHVFSIFSNHLSPSRQL